jgi:hypothetical protein
MPFNAMDPDMPDVPAPEFWGICKIIGCVMMMSFICSCRNKR